MTRLLKPTLFAVLTGAMYLSSASAQDVTFNGTVTGSCTVVVGGSGTLGVSTDFTQLSSVLAGGASGGATVTASDNSFNVNLAAASAFDTGPAGADTNTIFAALYDSSGATTATDVTAGTPTSLNAGVNTITVDASADKTSGIFEAGSYALTTTLTCAP